MEKDALVVVSMCTRRCPHVINFLLYCTHKISSISVGGSVCTTSHTQETDKGSNRGTILSMQLVSSFANLVFLFVFKTFLFHNIKLNVFVYLHFFRQ
jgi:hypothetical protein